MFACSKILLRGSLWFRGHSGILMLLQVVLLIAGDGYDIFLMCVFITGFILASYTYFHIVSIK